MKKLLSLLPLALVAAILALPGAVSAEYGHQKVVYHVNYDDPARHKAALGNIQNHINAVGADKMDIKVIMHGPGLGLLRNALTDADIQAGVDNLRLQGVDFGICNVTVTRGNIDILTDLYDSTEANLVPSGVAEISHLQTQGYTYLRP
ncbi:DsrE family protein [Thioalkalivibrio sp.]|jgi:uncharacterized protein|uniref:DsrE family protein n=1 Tax=Thioalkalivibrio sp. TaxID=2093813 RepID=UPI0012D4E391|nr:DsrE family protein [Thioalkalivibrio sp.]TVP83162.1 MAG: hypothetical protein EA346_00950 [Thioalkalivibrio sp.]